MIESMRYTLCRVVNKRARYYRLSSYKTLFYEYLLEIEYGSMKNKKPTRIIREYFSTLESLSKKRSQIIEQKMKKGYECYG